MDGDAGQRRPPPAGEAIGYSTRIDPAGPGPAQLAPMQSTPQPDSGEHPPEAPAKPPAPRWKKALFWGAGLLVVAALATGAVLYWLHSRHFESTDDAFIDAHIAQVSSQVAARVVRVAAEDNQAVRAGQTLVELDPQDFQIRLDTAQAQRLQAAAQLEQARAQALLQGANLDQAAANVRVAEADLGQAQTELARYRGIDPKAITRQVLDNASAAAKAAQARLDASRQAVRGARAQTEAQRAQVAAAEAALQAAEVAVQNAALQLSRARIVAPQDGRVTKRTVEVGNYVNPGQALLAVVGERMWVTANFKETQLAHMRPGQAVRVRVDACPGTDLQAHVDSVQAGSGSVFSALPAENATGNFVKVVQRVPVKIVFEDGQEDACRLAPGLSAEPRVTVR